MANLPSRDAIEAEFQRRIQRLFDATRREIDRKWKLHGKPEKADLEQILEGFRMALLSLVTPELEDIYTLALETNESIIGVAIDWSLVNERAANWARTYTFDKVRELTDLKRRVLQTSIDDFYRQGLDLGGLTRRMEREFGEKQAKVLAITETTRAASAGEVEYVQQLSKLGVEMIPYWVTNADDRVCPKCGPINNKRQGDGWTEYPPYHWGCRCWIRHKVVLPTGKALPQVSRDTYLPSLPMAQAAHAGFKHFEQSGFGLTSAGLLLAADIRERREVSLPAVRRIAAQWQRASSKSASDAVAQRLLGGNAAMKWASEIISEVGHG